MAKENEKVDIQANAEAWLVKNPEHKHVWLAKDGNFFTEANKSYAIDHNIKLKGELIKVSAKAAKAVKEENK
jgi:hypothetical protein